MKQFYNSTSFKTFKGVKVNFRVQLSEGYYGTHILLCKMHRKRLSIIVLQCEAKKAKVC